MKPQTVFAKSLYIQHLLAHYLITKLVVPPRASGMSIEDPVSTVTCTILSKGTVWRGITDRIIIGQDIIYKKVMSNIPMCYLGPR